MGKVPSWLSEAPLQQFFAATHDAGGEARAVGGCVRDYLMGVAGGDVDLASTLPPEKTQAIAAQHGWKAVPTGIDHGTVTLVLPSRAVEVTTLRRDVTTDGRRATIAYTDSWQEDAARRDFSFNALYMDAKGTITDFFGGREDLAARRVRFIGDAGDRIAEDGLRILRYFRFLATHGNPPADGDALAAIAAQKAMIEKLSGERIANEMRKFLAADNPSYSLRMLAEAGVAPYIFGGDIDTSRMIRLQLLESQAHYTCSVWARALLLGAKPEYLITRWKLARHEAQQLRRLAAQSAFDATAPRHHHTRILRLEGAPAYLDWLLTQAAQTPGINIAAWAKLACEFRAPTFPVAAADLLARGMKEGKELGERLRALEAQWETSDYTLTKEELLNCV